MSLVCGSLSCSSVCGASRFSVGFGQCRGIAGVRSRGQVRLRRQGFGVASAVREEGEPSPAGGELEDEASVALNQVAPPVGNVFGSEAKEVSVLEDPVGFVKSGLERKAEAVRHAFQAVEDAVAPSPYSPAQGNDVVVFFFLSAFLGLSFWLGNYVVPRWIFKDTVFRNIDEEDEYVQEENPSEEAVDPADLIELPTNLMPFRGAAVEGFKAGRQKARDAAQKGRMKKANKSK